MTGKNKRKGIQAMGMSASQVRFLSLQSRKNNISRQLSGLSNRKMALSRDMNKVAKNYTNALNQINLKWSNDCGVNYNPLSYDLMMKPNEINTDRPYIVTDNKGRVVLDDKAIWFDKEHSRMLYGQEALDANRNAVTYKELAAMLSAYSGATQIDDEIILNFNNTSNVEGGVSVGGLSPTGENYLISATNSLSGGKCLDETGYKIVTGIQDYNYQNNIRYQIFEKLGLVSSEDNAEFQRLLNELYGSEAAYKYTSYSKLLHDFDDNPTMTLEDGKTYGDIFGNFDISTFSIDESTGCIAGNLALAKAFQEEYQDFLNTPINVGIESEIDNNITDLGVSDRIAKDVLRLSPDSQGEYYYSPDSLISQLSNRMINDMTLSDGTNFLYSLYEYGKSKDSDDHIWYIYSSDQGSTYLNSCGKSSASLSDDNHVNNWGALYNNYAAFRTGKARKSHDVGHNMNEIIIENIIEGYATSLKMTTKASGVEVNSIITTDKRQSNNISEQAIAYATKKTFELYTEPGGYDTISQHSGASNPEQTAANEANKIFGLARKRWHNTHDSAVVVSARNIMIAFNTFYQSYFESAQAVLNEGGTINVDSTLGYDPQLGMHEIQRAGIKTTLSDAFSEYSGHLDEGNIQCAQNSCGGYIVGTTWTGTDDNITYKLESSTTDTSGKTENKISCTYTGDDGNSYTFYKFINYDSYGSILNIVETDNTTYSTVTSYTDGVASETKYYESGSSSPVATYTEENNSTGRSGTVVLNNANAIHIATGCDVTEITYNYDSNEWSASGMKNGSDFTFSDEIYSGETSVKEYWYGGTLNTGRPTNCTYYLNADNSSSTWSRDRGDGSIIATKITIYPTDEYSDKFANLVSYWQELYDKKVDELENCYSSVESKFMDYFDALFERISENGWVYDKNVEQNNETNANSYLNAMLQNNIYFVTTCRDLNTAGKYQYTTQLATNVKKIYQVHDDNAENQALAEYEADKTLIQSKEKVIDNRMLKLETEQEAINTEMESIKKVRDDNIQRFFKIFA